MTKIQMKMSILLTISKKEETPTVQTREEVVKDVEEEIEEEVIEDVVIEDVVVVAGTQIETKVTSALFPMTTITRSRNQLKQKMLRNLLIS